MTTPPPLTNRAVRGPLIEDYGLIGDLQTAALVCRDGSVDWACPQHFDAPAVFAGLLGTDEHGFWRIGPAVPNGVPAPYADRRRYRGDSLIVESEWDTGTGTVRVLDLMPPRDGHGPQLIRIVEGVTGTVEMTSTFVPRFGYGRLMPWIYDEDGRTADHIHIVATLVCEDGSRPDDFRSGKRSNEIARLRLGCIRWQPSTCAPLTRPRLGLPVVCRSRPPAAEPPAPAGRGRGGRQCCEGSPERVVGRSGGAASPIPGSPERRSAAR